MSDELNDLYQQVILDHSKAPRNFKKLETANRVADGHNPLCGDHIRVYLHVEGDTVQDISFEGSGCAISKASASMMTATLKGKKTAEVRKMFEEFQEMIKTGAQPAGDTLGKLAVFSGVHRFPSRIKCAILPWHAVVATIEGKTEPVSTE
jgi:nitrogen fixation protein NifU and related proteins